MCFLKLPSATPFTNWSTSTRKSSFAQGSRSGYPGKSEMAWAHLGLYPRLRICTCRGGVSQVQWTLLLSASLSYFRPRVHCCVAWYNALLAHLHSKIEWVQMRAVKIIYLSKLYSLLKSLDLRTGAVSSVWALWKYLQKEGRFWGSMPPYPAPSGSLLVLGR